MADDVAVSVELKQKLASTKAPIWKTILWWGLGGLVIVLGAIGVLYLIRRKGPVESFKNSVTATKNEISKSDLEAKIKVAEAEKAEKVVIDKLKEIKELPDEKQRLDALNALL